MIHLYAGSVNVALPSHRHHSHKRDPEWQHRSLCGKVVDRSDTTNESAIEHVGCKQCLRVRLFKRRAELVKLSDRIARLEKLIAAL